MEITKKDFEDISKLIFDSYLTKDVFLLETYFTMRNVSTSESDKITEKYRYKDSPNFYIMLDILSLAIIKIGGLKIDNPPLVRRKLANSNARIITFFYEQYTELVQTINKFADILDIYIETDESKTNWKIFKNFSNHYNFTNLNTLNGFQKGWILINLQKDNFNEEKQRWSRASFMTNAICAFTNGKQYNQNKSALNVMDRYDAYDREIDENRRIAEDVEAFSESVSEVGTMSKRGRNYLNKDHELFDNLSQKGNETKEDYKARMEEALIKRLKHETIDDHDKIIKHESIKKFIVVLYEHRKRCEIANRIYEMKQEITGEEEEILGPNISEEEMKGEFFHNNVDYREIINTKGLHFVTKEEKKKIFDEIMSVKIDVDKEANDYIKKIQEKKMKLKEQNKNLDSMGFMPLTKE